MYNAVLPAGDMDGKLTQGLPSGRLQSSPDTECWQLVGSP